MPHLRPETTQCVCVYIYLKKMKSPEMQYFPLTVLQDKESIVHSVPPIVELEMLCMKSPQYKMPQRMCRFPRQIHLCTT